MHVQEEIQFKNFYHLGTRALQTGLPLSGLIKAGETQTETKVSNILMLMNVWICLMMKKDFLGVSTGA